MTIRIETAIIINESTQQGKTTGVKTSPKICILEAGSMMIKIKILGMASLFLK